MNTTSITICALPDPIWEKSVVWGEHTINIHAFIEDAISIEHRIHKGVNQENERSRYNLCCDRIEAGIKLLNLHEISDLIEFENALALKCIPIVTLSQDYIDTLKLAYQRSEALVKQIRLGATFFPPQFVDKHIDGFEKIMADLGLSDHTDMKMRDEFFRFAEQNHCGIIEFQNPIVYKQEIHKPQIDIDKGHDIFTDDRISNEVTISDNEGKNAYDTLFDQVSLAIKNERSGKRIGVNFSNQPHSIITEVLNRLSYSDSGLTQRPRYISVIYTDGSQAADFPLNCLPVHDAKDLNVFSNTQPIRAALLSMRHLEMDDKVDMSWFRNREVSKARTFAETDQFCYEETKRLLKETRNNELFVLNLYQTGLQPAIIGFYRALIEELLYRGGLPLSLKVVPFYFNGISGYKQGRVWY